MVDISNSYWSETDANNTQSPPNGWPASTYFNQVGAIGQATMGAVKRFWDRVNGTVTTTGASGTYVYTPANTSYPVAYVNGETYSFKAHQDSAGSDTFQINAGALAAITMYKFTSSGSSVLAAGDIKNGATIVGQYDSNLSGFVVTGGLVSSVTGGVTSFTGDGVLMTNSASTGAVTATLASQTKNTIYSGPSTGANATPTFRTLVAADIPIATSSAVGGVKPDGTIITVSGAGAITVPNATSGAKGVVQVDGTTITASSGVISASNTLIMTPGSVGAIILAKCSSTPSAGGTVAAAALTAYSANGTSSSQSLSGTWQALQNVQNSADINLFQRTV